MHGAVQQERWRIESEKNMILPIQITFRNMESSATVERWIRRESLKLDEFYDRIMGCRVMVEIPSRHRRWGNLYHVRIDLTVPGGELVVKREPSIHAPLQQTQRAKLAKHLEVKTPHKELRQAIDDAFKAMGRRLQDYARRQRGDVKTHEPAPRARISKLLPVEGYGYLETPGGREIYFHRNSVTNEGFDQLKIGTTVRFVEGAGEKGPQASTVKRVRDRRTQRSEALPVAKPREAVRA
jgi:cold shock CspA family protein/ribosome-associated translation inhibitor RaiA